MMNDLGKFRVWDGEEMHEPPFEDTYVKDKGDGRWVMLEEALKKERTEYDRQVCSYRTAKRLYYTGLEDEEGTPMYQHDIVRHPSAGVQIVCWQGVTGGWTVQDSLDDTPYVPTSEDMTGLTVVGNRFENPNLLEQTTQNNDQ